MPRYHIDDDAVPMPPLDWVERPDFDLADACEEAETRASTLAVIALLCGALGLGLGYLIWS